MLNYEVNGVPIQEVTVNYTPLGEIQRLDKTELPDVLFASFYADRSMETISTDRLIPHQSAYIRIDAIPEYLKSLNKE